VPYYADMNPEGAAFSEASWGNQTVRTRTLERLLALRAALSDEAAGIPPRTLGNLLLGTWNLREFDADTWGRRLPESYAYIAEVCSRFDLIAIQEVRESLVALEKLVHRLGRHWDYLVSDVTDKSLTRGNGERLAFVYDTRKVRFLGQAGELVLPPLRRKNAAGKLDSVPVQQVARTPLMAAFQVGWTQFVLTTVHVIWGPSDDPSPPERVEEIKQIARFLKERSDTETESIHNFIVLGDFNIDSVDAPTMLALQQGGDFTIPDALIKAPGSNIARNKKYDQIAFRNRPERFQHIDGSAGVFDYYQHVFTDADEATYRPHIDDYIKECRAKGQTSPKTPATAKDARNQYRLWRTYQMSDHLPLWAQFQVDFTDPYLTGLKNAPPPATAAPRRDGGR
jgi:endonuclease/exonuclease/phosphatase family metal-dependent hydrolase